MRQLSFIRDGLPILFYYFIPVTVFFLFVFIFIIEFYPN